MWLFLAFVSATFLGFYDSSKKASLKDNAVLPVLLINTVLSTILFSPFLIDYLGGMGWFNDPLLSTAPYAQQAEISAEATLQAHLLVILKAFIVLSSWIMGYFGLKHLPLTIVGPINATRPVMVLVGAMLLFGERLNGYQWIGVLLSIVSIYMMSRAGKKENIVFTQNKWVWCVAGATIMGAISGLYDKFIMKSLSPMFVQSWFNFYQMLIMMVVCSLLWYPKRHQTTPFHWSWAIPLISIFICLADFAYYTSLHDQDSMISVVSD
jgi:transporter family protein